MNMSFHGLVLVAKTNVGQSPNDQISCRVHQLICCVLQLCSKTSGLLNGLVESLEWHAVDEIYHNDIEG